MLLNVITLFFIVYFLSCDSNANFVPMNNVIFSSTHTIVYFLTTFYSSLDENVFSFFYLSSIIFTEREKEYLSLPIYNMVQDGKIMNLLLYNSNIAQLDSWIVYLHTGNVRIHEGEDSGRILCRLCLKAGKKLVKHDGFTSTELFYHLPFCVSFIHSFLLFCILFAKHNTALPNS